MDSVVSCHSMITSRKILDFGIREQDFKAAFRLKNVGENIYMLIINEQIEMIR